MRPTTKNCSSCGSRSLVHFTSMNLKKCGICGTEMPWFLEEGQKPLIGPSRQIHAVKPNKQEEESHG